MLGVIEISPWHWVIFIACVVFFLALDLGVFHKSAHVVKFKEALAWSTVWFTLSLAFGLFIAPAMVSGWERKDTVDRPFRSPRVRSDPRNTARSLSGSVCPSHSMLAT